MLTRIREDTTWVIEYFENDKWKRHSWRYWRFFAKRLAKKLSQYSSEQEFIRHSGSHFKDGKELTHKESTNAN